MCRNPVGEGAKRTTTDIPGGWGAAAGISTISQFVLAKHLAQAGLHHLAGCRMRQFRDDRHVVWQHPAREAVGEERDQSVAVWMTAGSGHYDQQRPLAPAGMRNRNHGGFGDIVICYCGILQIYRAYPFAS